MTNKSYNITTDMNILQKIEHVRTEMTRAKIDAYIVSNQDPHLSEYLPDHWKAIEWLTGFTGEAATLVITLDDAALWTDSRFFIQGEKELASTPVRLMKSGLPETPSLTTWLRTQLVDVHPAPLHLIGLDNRLFTSAEIERFSREIVPPATTDDDLRLIMFRQDFRPLDHLWTDRPPLPQGALELYDATYSGERRCDRLSRIIHSIGDATLLLSALDEVAWAFGIRGTDIACTPVVTAFGLLSAREKILFIDPEKVSPENRDRLQADGITLAPYTECVRHLSALPSSLPVIASPGTTPAALMKVIRDGREESLINPLPSPIPLMKAIKNEVELQGFHNAMLKDGIAMTRFLIWLEDNLRQGEGLSEYDCVRKLRALRQEQPLYRDESFDAIVAWGEHGALPHYMPNPSSDTPIHGDGLLLIDTGGQYLDGTTDITRTLPIGQISEGERRDYTLTLKGHIRLARACFPAGTRGDQLDALARYDLWRDAKTYRHGTSHGIGHYLSVHEGPQSIRMEHNPTPLLPGMVISVEPAIYLQGRYGIRHENCYAVRQLTPALDAPQASPCLEGEYGDFLTFENLTLCPFATSALDLSLMTHEEIDWLNDYHRHVFDTLAPNLEDSERQWLERQTAPLS